LVALHSEARTVGSGLLRAGLWVATELGLTRPAERKRVLLTSAASPAAGDIMVYLARGDAIRQHIADTVAALDDGVVLLAHSLGGVACVDLLATAAPANVRGLITVGSQAPYLHELGALPGLAPGAALPETFPVPWINVLDRRDLLSFLAEPVFGDRVRDVEINSRAPFPRSHSAYFGNPALYAVVRSVVNAVTP
jgi:pimeloyl-ACP methyl ester carboxylesterase